MSLPQAPYKNRGPIPYSSLASPVAFTDLAPIRWVQVRTAGSGGLVVKDEGGTTRTYSGLVAGDVLFGPFTELTSMTCSLIWAGDGPVPSPPQASTVADLYQDAQTAFGQINLAPSAFYLLTGAPLAIFSNGSSAVPGSALVDSKTFAIRWNNNSTLNGVLSSFAIPYDMDLTVAPVVHVRAAKVGATLADATTFDVGLYNQVLAATEDADTNYGGTTGAMTGDATTKTIQDVSFTLTASDLPAAGGTVTITVKPTDGLLGTDDLAVTGVRVVYKRKLRVA